MIYTNGLTKIEQSDTNWRITYNSNISNIYTITETNTLLAGKSNLTHTHSEYANITLVESDMPTLVVDLAFEDGGAPALLDRVTGIPYYIQVTSGSITLNVVPATILYEGATISSTQFPITTNVDLSGNTILATADNATAEKLFLI